MKNFIFFSCILIILFKTGNVLSNNKIFDVNNIQINKEKSKNKEKMINEAFSEAFDKLLVRLLMEQDYQKFSNTNLQQIKKLISYYQISELEEQTDNKEIQINVSFDKERVHNFFYEKNILYSDIVNTEVILFPLLKKNKKYFIYTKNYFYDNWNNQSNLKKNLIQFNLAVENIENIEKINLNKDSIYKIDISDFFKEYGPNTNVVFLNIDIKGKDDRAEIFLNTRIQGKKIKKTITLKSELNSTQDKFYDTIILRTNNIIRDLIKSQNLIDVRTPSFLNVKLNINDISNLIEFKRKLNNIDLVNDFYVQQINKDYILIKIKYLGKISKIINSFKSQNINLKMIDGQWQISVI